MPGIWALISRAEFEGHKRPKEAVKNSYATILAVFWGLLSIGPIHTIRYHDTIIHHHGHHEQQERPKFTVVVQQ